MALFIGAALVAFVLIGVAAFATIATLELSSYVETRGSELGREASQVLSHGGRPALRNWLLEDAAIPEGVSVFVLDAAGQDIFGQALPTDYIDLIASSVVGTETDADDAFRPVRLAPQIIDADGNAYAFLVLPSNISLWGNASTAFGLIAVALLVIATVAWFIAGTIGRPVSELQQAVRRLAAGDVSARVPAALAARSDELGELAGDFNSMAEHLCELLEGREQLMSELSHELRSPLARLQASLALATAHNRLEEHERARIDTEIGLMNGTIGEILRYSSLNTPLKVKTRLVRCDQLLQELVDVEEVEALGQQCTLQLVITSELAVVGDPDLLRSAFENLIRNAIRYAPDASRITVRGWREQQAEGTAICVSVRDRGPGLPDTQLKSVFEPYVRHAQDSPGSGLGLAIVKRVMERHAGTVTAANCADQGLCVTCRLPAADFTHAS
jgi:two-component system OmpR family sensor kinase